MTNSRGLLLNGVTAGLGTSVLLLSATGHADIGSSPPHGAEVMEAPSVDITVIGFVGGRHYREDKTEAVLGVSGLYRAGLFAAGVDAEFATAIFGSTTYSACGMTGIAWRSDHGLRADLLGVAGVRHHQHWGGGGMLSSDPGASATMPYVGARLHVAYTFGSLSWPHFVLGGMFMLDHDSHKTKQTYSYVDAWNGRSATGQAEVGGTDVALTMTFGRTFDL
jgi:hypothetical protein